MYSSLSSYSFLFFSVVLINMQKYFIHLSLVFCPSPSITISPTKQDLACPLHSLFCVLTLAKVKSQRQRFLHWLSEKSYILIKLHIKKTLYLYIFDLQSFISFWCTTKWLRYIYIYTHTHIYIFSYFSSYAYYRILNIVSCTIYRTLLFIFLFIVDNIC